jgi:hypothetical protein
MTEGNKRSNLELGMKKFSFIFRLTNFDKLLAKLLQYQKPTLSVEKMYWIIFHILPTFWGDIMYDVRNKRKMQTAICLHNFRFVSHSKLIEYLDIMTLASLYDVDVNHQEWILDCSVSS